MDRKFNGPEEYVPPLSSGLITIKDEEDLVIVLRDNEGDLSDLQDNRDGSYFEFLLN